MPESDKLFALILSHATKAMTVYFVTFYKVYHHSDKNDIGHYERYFHCGNGSAGCVSVKDKNRWTEIAQFVSTCRLDDLHVGFLEVLDIK